MALPHGRSDTLGPTRPIYTRVSRRDYTPTAKDRRGLPALPAAWRFESPLLLTRAQGAELCQVSEEILDQWSYEPGFPVFRRHGGHFVRIHRPALERWLEQLALGTNPGFSRVTRLRRRMGAAAFDDICERTPLLVLFLISFEKKTRVPGPQPKHRACLLSRCRGVLTFVSRPLRT